jgi:beta-phosphoglucomutase-like phosphatase (HAD superfamily)
VPVRNRTPEDEQPLARSVGEQPLARSVGGEQEEAAQAEPHGAEEEQTAPQAEETRQGEKGPVTRAMDKAQENNWVYDAVAEKAREKGLLDKADEFLNRARNKLGA